MIDQAPSKTYNCIRCGGQFYSEESARSHSCASVGMVSITDASKSITYNCNGCGGNFYNIEDAKKHDCSRVNSGPRTK